jgi:Icc-related predicted phosphoesterase
MRVHVVSDVHGTTDALAQAGDGADMLICLGDMLLFLDYADHTQGIFAELYGAENAWEYIDLRTQRRFDEARDLTRRIASRLTAERGADLSTLTDQAIRRQYAAMFGALAEPAYLTYGNVDVPRIWADYLKPGHQVIDGGRVVVSGGGGGRSGEAGGRAGEEGARVVTGGGQAGEKQLTFGFVGAGLISPYLTPNEIPPPEFEAKLDAVGAVDVLCTHIPPAIPELLYDTVARRMETGSTALLDLIRRTQPRYALFGHVHNPLARRVRVGRTECVNVGHFRATRAPYVIDL